MFYAILIKMRDTPHLWQAWAATLEKWGLQKFAAWLLEATGPVNFIGAQLVYVGQPFLNIFAPREHVHELAQLLEEPAQTREFITFLREEHTP